MAGIACAGNWIVDKVKIIDNWPNKGELANIISETTGAGGSPFNILVDYAHLGVDFPTYGFGCLGKDSAGEEALAICKKEGVNTDYLTILDDVSTSYTDVMSMKSSGERTFFHCRGANAQFSPDHVDLNVLKEKNIKIFLLGYLLLLDGMDANDPEYGTVAARMLKNIQDCGVETSVDVVSEASDRFNRIVTPALPYVDHLIINEIEAGKITGLEIRKADNSYDMETLKKAAAIMLEKGVKKTAVIHMPEGAYWEDSSGTKLFMGSLKEPDGYIVGKTGAGDAFCAGALLGIHEGWSAEETLDIARGVAATSMSAANTTDGVAALDEVRRICKEWAPE